MTGTTKRPDRVVLLNPGPVNVHDRVRAALAGPDECHREPESQGLLGTVGGKITEVCGAGRDSHATVLFTGSGTAALEAVLSSAVPADGRLLVLDNGHYGERLLRIADVHGIATVRLEFGWAVPLDPDAVDQALAADAGITHVAVVHHETSTGMLNPLRGLGPLVARHGRSLIADAISSLGAQDLDVVRDHVDWCVGTASECLEGMPGISFVCAPRERLEALADVPARLLLPPERRASSITNAHLANGMTYNELHDGLKEHGYVICAAQEKPAGVFRLASMGQLTDEDIAGFFRAFDEVVARYAPSTR